MKIFYSDLGPGKPPIQLKASLLKRFWRGLRDSFGSALVVVLLFTVSPFSVAWGDGSIVSGHGIRLDGYGWWWTQRVEVTSESEDLRIYFAADSPAQAMVFRVEHLQRFRDNQNVPAILGFGPGFDYNYGGDFFTLKRGVYVVGVRNQVRWANNFSLELDRFEDYRPAGAVYEDHVIADADWLDPGQSTWQRFEVVAGKSYTIQGLNTGLETHIVTESALADFRSGRSFHSISPYSGSALNLPGYHQLSLSPGRYYVLLLNRDFVGHSYVYILERWDAEPLVAPRGLIASQGTETGTVSLTWEPVRGAESYIVLRGTSGNPFEAVGVGEPTASQFHDSSVQPDVQYHYWVVARGNGGTGDISHSAIGWSGRQFSAEYQAWVAGFFDIPALQSRTADPDGDGRINELEMALGSDPARPDDEPIMNLLLSAAKDVVILRHTQATRFQSLFTFEVKETSNLQSWKPMDSSRWVSAEEGGITVKTLTVPRETGLMKFYSLTVTARE